MKTFGQRFGPFIARPAFANCCLIFDPYTESGAWWSRNFHGENREKSFLSYSFPNRSRHGQHGQQGISTRLLYTPFLAYRLKHHVDRAGPTEER